MGNYREPMLSIMGKLHVEFKAHPQIDKELKDVFIEDIGKYQTPPSPSVDLNELEDAVEKVTFELDKFAVFMNKYVVRSTTMEFISVVLKIQHGYYFHPNGEVYRLDYSPRMSEILYMPEYLRMLRKMGIQTKGYLQSPVVKHVDVQQE